MNTEQAAKARVLLVEDNATNLKILSGILTKLDCELITASTGRDAMGAIAENHFALILLDINLPDMDGFQIARTLSEDSRKRETPLIFLTATFKDEISRLKGYELGAVDYILKPVEPFILQSKVEVFLDLYHSQLRQMELRRLLHKRNQELETEITERQKAEEAARHQASHDPLTDLPNRLLFMDRFETALARARREQRRMALIYIDLDKFKPVNDEHGHHAGDALLKAVARRLSSQLREADTVARLGGDEFAVLLEDIQNRKDAEQVMEKLAQALDQPFSIEPLPGNPEITVQIGGSFGLSIYPDDAEEEEALLHEADVQMYEMKKAHKH